MEITKPKIISKSDALTSKPNHLFFNIPQEWFDVINEYLRLYKGQPISIKVTDIKKRYLETKNPQEIQAIWFDIEPYYIAEGWVVTFHKSDPGSTEPSYYTFK
jgi:hypothetical protein